MLAYKEAIAKNLDSLVSDEYKAILSSLRSAIDAINELEYDLYISEDSQYLHLLDELNKYNDDLVKLYAQLSKNENIDTILAEIKNKEEMINQVNQNIDTLMSLASYGIKVATETFNDIYAQIEEFEREVQNINFNEILTNVEKSANDTNNGILKSFMVEFSDEITKIKAKVEERKSSLENK